MSYDYYSREPTDWAELRRKANANLAELNRNKDKPKPEPKRHLTELDTATADDIEHGHMIIEMRQLTKIDRRYARKPKLTQQEHAEWEEIYGRLETLQESFKHCRRDEIARWVRIYNKSLKRGMAK